MFFLDLMLVISALNLFKCLMINSILYRYQLASNRRQSRPRPHWTRYGEGRKEYEKEAEELAQKEAYLNSLEASRTVPYRVIESLRSFDEKELDLELVMVLIKHICSSMGDGAILVFLPGWDTITKLNDMLMASPVFRGNRYLIIPLHSMMPTAFQQKVRKHSSSIWRGGLVQSFKDTWW